jgi:hypothetical protein
MPIYEYFCPDNNKIYQFYAKTVAQGQSIPKCPDNPDYQIVKRVSGFAIGSGARKSTSEGPAQAPEGGSPAGTGDDVDDPRMEAAFGQLEQEMEGLDENDPKAMGRMMRRMSELTGENLDGEMKEVVRKLEEGQDPERIEEEMGDVLGDLEGDVAGEYGGMGGSGGPPTRDPILYDY